MFQGLRLNFVIEPEQLSAPKSLNFSKKQSQAILSEIQNLLLKCVIGEKTHC